LKGSETHHLIFRRNDVIDEKTQAAPSQIGREEKTAAADEVSSIVCYHASIAQLKVMGFAALNPSYGLRSTHGLSARRFQRIATAEIQFPLLPSGVNSGGLSLPLLPKKLLPL
jgi:hypothetical protein